MNPYILRADGRVHTSDVRHVSFGYLDESQLTTGTRSEAAVAAHLYDTESHVRIITSSRDSTSILSGIPIRNVEVDTRGDEITPLKVFAGHEAFVNFALLHTEGLDFLTRCGDATGDGVHLVTGSNDKHVLVWSVQTAMLEAVLDGHQTGVTSGDIVRTLPSRSGNAKGSTTPTAAAALDAASFHGDIVTGDWTGVVIVFSHESGKPKLVYDRHANAIRGVVHLPDTTIIVSVSGDKSIHCWDMVRLAQERVNALAVTGPVSQVLKGHEDVVQCVCAIGNSRGRSSNGTGDAFYCYFATGSNDCTVRVWAVESTLKDAHPVKVLHGHDSLVYGLCFNTFTGELLSASEDRSVRVWGSSANRNTDSSGNVAGAFSTDADFSGFVTRQLVQHPCVVWSVAVCRVRSAAANDNRNDVAGEDLLITGGADSMVRLWTRNDEKFASVEKLEMLEEAIAAQRVDVKLLGEGGGAGSGYPFSLAELPCVDEIHQYRGKSEGEKKFFKNESNEIEVYIWANGRWEKIGVVVSGDQPVGVSRAGETTGPATGAPAKRIEKKLHNGKYFDYVFDVDVNGHMLKLPYNAGESVFEAAQNFINDHSMLQNFGEDPAARAGNTVLISQEHKEDIVNFIMKSIDPADIQKIPGLGGNAGDGAEPSPQSGQRNEVSLEDTQWSTADLIEVFNADGAQQKANEFLTQSAPDQAAAFADIMQEVKRKGALNESAPAAAVSERLAKLFAALPLDKKFPALDATRYAIGEAPQHAAVFLAALGPHLGDVADSHSSECASFTYTPATDADALVCVRLVSNLLPALMTPSVPAATSATARYTMVFLTWLVSQLVPNITTTSGPRNASVRQTLAGFYLRNLSVLLRILLSRGGSAGREGGQAFDAFRANVSLASAAEEVQMMSMLGSGFVCVLGSLLAAHADLAPLLMRSVVTVGVELPSSGKLRIDLQKVLEPAAVATDARPIVQSTRAALRL